MNMRTLRAVLLGFLVTSMLVLAAAWASAVFLGSAAGGEYTSPTLSAALLTLLYTAAAVVAGAYLTTKIHDSGDAISGFIILQLFFGFGLVREFWLVGSSWYADVALALVIPCAIIGRQLARTSRRGRMAGVV
jgi:hypothetical protein